MARNIGPTSTIDWQRGLIVFFAIGLLPQVLSFVGIQIALPLWFELTVAVICSGAVSTIGLLFDRHSSDAVSTAAVTIDEVDLLAIRATLLSSRTHDNGLLVMQPSSIIFRVGDQDVLQLKRRDTWVTFPAENIMQVAVVGEVHKWTLQGDSEEQSRWKQALLS